MASVLAGAGGSLTSFLFAQPETKTNKAIAVKILIDDLLG
jgi:hypothetical protein